MLQAALWHREIKQKVSGPGIRYHAKESCRGCGCVPAFLMQFKATPSIGWCPYCWRIWPKMI